MSLSDVKPKSKTTPEPIRLSSIRIINRILYVNNDPGMNYLLPLDNGWKLNELADHIMRACVEYDVKANYESARYLALRLTKEMVKNAPPKRESIADAIAAAKDEGYYLDWN